MGIGGGGKGGGGGRQSSAPTEIDNTLRSRDKVRVLFALAEGECKGFPNNDALRNIYLDDTPIQNVDGSLNFTDFAVEFTGGSPAQTPIPGFNDLEREYSNDVSLPVIVKNGTPVTRTLTDLEADAVRIRIGTDAFLRRDKDGNVTTTSVAFRIAISGNGGPFIERHVASFDGKSSGAYQREFSFALAGVSGPWAIRIERITPDSRIQGTTDLEIRDNIYFSAFTGIRYSANPYNGVALLALSMGAEQFRSIPEVSLNWQGLGLIHIPQNYDSEAKIYSGLFNGGLGRGYTTNPAWCLFESLVNPVWGMAIPIENLDVYSFYSLGRHCDERVNDGQGGQHVRFRFDCRFETAGNAYEVIQAIASSMHAQIYLEGGSIKLIPDTYDEPSQIYGPENVIVGYADDGRLEKPAFNYQSLPEPGRYTAAIVRWSNPELNYQEDFEEVRDIESIAKYGYNAINVDAVGCTRRAQAIREARYQLFVSLYQRELVNFAVGDEGGLISPGETALVQDSEVTDRQDLAGRIASVSITFIRLDRTVSLDAGDVCEFQTFKDGDRIVRRFVADRTEVTNELPLIYDGQTRPSNNDFWILTIEGQYQANRWKILRVAANEDESGSYSLEGLRQDIDKALYIETFSLSDKSYGISQLFSSIGSPVNLEVFEGQVNNGGSIQNNIELLWGAPATPFVQRYDVQHKLSDSSDWVNNATTNTSYLIRDVGIGTYDLRVRSVSISGAVSDWVQTSSTLAGLAGAPKDIEEFSITGIEDNLAVLKWRQSRDLDVREGGYLQINHSTAQPGTWHQSLVLQKNVPGMASEINLPLKNGTYLIKAIDSDGKESVNAASATTDLEDVVLKNIITGFSERAGGFAGTSIGFSTTSAGDLELTTKSSIGAYLAPMSTVSTMRDLGQGSTENLTEADYIFENVVDLPAVYEMRADIDVDSVIYTDKENIGDVLIPMRQLSAGFFQANLQPSGIDLIPKIRRDIGFGWQPWEDFVQGGKIIAQKLQGRILAESKDNRLNVTIKQISISVDMPDRTEFGRATTSGSGPISISYKRPYYSAPEYLSITIRNPAPSDIVLVANEAYNGFSVSVVDNENNRMVREIKWAATGIGKEL